MAYIPRSKEEAEYLKNYDPSKYKNPAVAADVVLFGFDCEEKSLKVLMVRRGGYPYQGDYCFPGGFVNIEEHIHAAAQRELEEETGVGGLPLELFYAMGDPDRDPRQRVISEEYLGLVDARKVRPKAGDDAAEAAWFTVKDFSRDRIVRQDCIRERIRIVIGEGDRCFDPVLIRDIRFSNGYVQQSVQTERDGGIAFDHARVSLYALERLQERLQNSPIAMNALGERFSKQALLDLYRAAFLEKGLDLSTLAKVGLRMAGRRDFTFLPLI